MSNTCLDALVAWSHQQFGLVITEHQQSLLEDRVQVYLKQHHLSADEFMFLLLKKDEKIIRDSVNLLTVNESYFFRDASLFSILKTHFFTKLIAEKRASGVKCIRIWSAGCAKGEELYSIAILLLQLIPDIEAWKIYLLGTDINEDVIRDAKKACYSALALRATNEKIKHTYFLKKQPYYQLIPAVRDMVTFRYGNLAKESSYAECFDFIFCRNGSSPKSAVNSH